MSLKSYEENDPKPEGSTVNILANNFIDPNSTQSLRRGFFQTIRKRYPKVEKEENKRIVPKFTSSVSIRPKFNNKSKTGKLKLITEKNNYSYLSIK